MLGKPLGEIVKPEYPYDTREAVIQKFLEEGYYRGEVIHHRRDGSVYPRGLKGEQIPLGARVFAIVDVWDALTSDRPYRKAWTRQEALKYIQEQAGSHFDPEIVAAFVRMISATM